MGANIFDESSLLLVDCSKTSFFQICELFIRTPRMRKPLHNICCLMRKTRARWLMVQNAVEKTDYFEDKYPSVYEEILYLKKKYPNSEISAKQLTFFSSDILWPPSQKKKYLFAIDKKKPTRKKNVILTTCVIIWITTNKNRGESFVDYIYEAVVSIPSIILKQTRLKLLNNYIHVFDKADVIVGGEKLEVTTSYYCQQNSLTSVCAHSSLKMALWHADEGRYQPHTHVMNDIVRGIRNKKGERYVPSKGIRIEEIREICKHYQNELFEIDFTNNKNANVSPYEMAYLLVESGIPTIIVFKPKAGGDDLYHMVPVIGHTFNSDEWLPLAIRHYKDFPPAGLKTIEHDYISSAEWASHLIIHDDLLGPYLCITPQSLTRKARPDEDYAGRTCYVLGILPKGLQKIPSPVIAQEIGAVYFWNIWDRLLCYAPEKWKNRIEELWNGKNKFKNLVLRTQIIKKDKFLTHLAELEDHEENHSIISKANNKKLYRRLTDVDLLWMVEFSLPELFCANKSKIGEIVFPLEAAFKLELLDLKKGDEYPPPLCYRLFGCIDIFDDMPINIRIKSHTRLYRKLQTGFEY